MFVKQLQRRQETNLLPLKAAALALALGFGGLVQAGTQQLPMMLAQATHGADPSELAATSKSHQSGMSENKSDTKSDMEHAQRTESHIKDLHSKLEITPAQETQWQKVTQIMRDNAKKLDDLVQKRKQGAENMNAIDDLKSYQALEEAHVAGVREFTPAFATLYDSMSDEQKKNADNVFRNQAAKMEKTRAKAK